MDKPKLYVGNLPYSVDDAGLSSLFSSFGTVKSAKVITDRESGKSKGFGFVEFEKIADAESAADGLNGKEVAGRALTVNEARERPKKEYQGSNRR